MITLYLILWGFFLLVCFQKSPSPTHGAHCPFSVVLSESCQSSSSSPSSSELSSSPPSPVCCKCTTKPSQGSQSPSSSESSSSLTSSVLPQGSQSPPSPDLRPLSPELRSPVPTWRMKSSDHNSSPSGMDLAVALTHICRPLPALLSPLSVCSAKSSSRISSPSGTRVNFSDLLVIVMKLHEFSRLMNEYPCYSPPPLLPDGYRRILSRWCFNQGGRNGVMVVVGS